MPFPTLRSGPLPALRISMVLFAGARSARSGSRPIVPDAVGWYGVPFVAVFVDVCRAYVVSVVYVRVCTSVCRCVCTSVCRCCVLRVRVSYVCVCMLSYACSSNRRLSANSRWIISMIASEFRLWGPPWSLCCSFSSGPHVCHRQQSETKPYWTRGNP